jgi:hypothetical protein
MAALAAKKDAKLIAGQRGVSLDAKSSMYFMRVRFKQICFPALASVLLRCKQWMRKQRTRCQPKIPQTEH